MRSPAILGSAVACALIAAAMTLPTGPALAAASQGDYVGKSEAEVSKTLQKLGYDVRSLESEDGYLEAYALSEGGRFAIYVNLATGKIVKIDGNE
jgi:Peptidase propeptide and YPEB domain